MSDIEDRVRQLGQKFKTTSQDAIKRQVDDPIQALRERIAAQSQGQAGQGQQGAPGAAMGRPMGAQMPRNEIPEVLPNDPRMSSQDQELRMGAMISAAENMQALRDREAKMRQQMELEDEVKAQEQAEFDPASYKPVNREAITPPAKFGNLKSRLSEQGALTSQDMQKFAAPKEGAIELSEDPEEQARQMAAARLGQ